MSEASPAGSEPIVDTRTPGAGSCASLTTEAVDSLAVHDSFLLVSDHDPRALHYLLDAERPGLVSWQLVEDGPVRWQVRISRIGSST